MEPATYHEIAYYAPLKKGAELYVDQDYVRVVSEKRGVEFELETKRIRCIFPNDGNITIFWLAEEPIKASGPVMHWARKYTKFEMDYNRLKDPNVRKAAKKTEPEVAARSIQKAAQKGHERNVPLKDGRLVMHDDERLLAKYHARSEYGTGILYITTSGAYLVDVKKGLRFQMSIKDLVAAEAKRNALTILYKEPVWMGDDKNAINKKAKFEVGESKKAVRHLIGAFKKGAEPDRTFIGYA